MTPFEHLKAKLEHAQSIDADVVRVDIEELASVLDELKELKTAKKNCRECFSRCLDCDKRIKAYNEGRADAIDECKKLIKARITDNLGLENATKYGNKNAEQQAESYSTVMRYEIAGCVEDLLDDLEQLKEKKND